MSEILSVTNDTNHFYLIFGCVWTWQFQVVAHFSFQKVWFA